MSKFDDVRIPLSYFKEIVSKEQLSILKYAERTDKFFQTRCLDCKGRTYRINRKKLYKQKKDGKLDATFLTDTIVVYNSIKHSDGNRYSFEFNIRVVDGIVENVALYNFGQGDLEVMEENKSAAKKKSPKGILGFFKNLFG
tara:strand:+ start:34 stop:456 length:423 start_codon:yes stop_codon:yes gene_type:complete